MDTPTKCHLGFGLAVTVWAVSGLLCKWSSCIVAIPLVVIDLYLAVILFEAARRSELHNEKASEMLNNTPAELAGALRIISEGRRFKFPSLTCSLLQILFILIAVVSGFAAMYIQSGEITNSTSGVLAGRIDGLYFSMVTMTTLGYGDFAPTCSWGRILVIWQLITGFLLLLGIFPLVVARLSTYK